MDDAAGFDEFCRELWPAACDTGAARLPCRADAEDVAQRVFVRLLKNARWRSLRNPKAYVARAIQREAAGDQDAGPPHVSLDDDAAPTIVCGRPLPDRVAASKEAQRGVQERLRCLPSKCQEMTRLAMEGVPYREVAERMGISQKAVEHQVRRGKRLLRESLSPFEDVGG